MSTFVVKISSSAARELKALDRDVLLKVDAVIRALATTPRPDGCKALVGVDAYRVRVSTRIGPLRIIYGVNDADGRVDILAVRHRRDAYR